MLIKTSVIQALIITAFIMIAAPASAAEDPGIFAIRVPDEGPLLDAGAKYWNIAPAFQVTMMPQTMTTPSNPNPAIKHLKVRAVHNGQWVSVQVEWEDPSLSNRIVVDQFGDQVAVEFPMFYKKDDLPSPMMGNPGKRVDIWQWRAAFQRDLDEGEPGIKDLYPNAMVDVYPDEMLRATDARPYMGAVGVDNMISHPKESPVLEQMAEGFGTLTTVPGDQDTDGRGAWKDGKWIVVFTHPLAPFSKNSAHFAPGRETVAGFAVWDGGNREVGARKAWASWIPFRLAK